MLCLPSGPADELETCTLFFIAAIGQARTRLWIASPYFVPDEQFVTALQLAALRGVDVRVLVPDHSDSLLVNLSGWSYVEALEQAGVAMYRYEAGFMHQKVTLIDDDWCTVGTANFDNRSFRLNFEVTMAVLDRGLAADVRRMLEDDFARSRRVRAADLKARSPVFRFAVRAGAAVGAGAVVCHAGLDPASIARQHGSRVKPGMTSSWTIVSSSSSRTCSSVLPDRASTWNE